MQVYLGFDDTDALDAPYGTGKLVRCFAKALPWGCVSLGMVRQQPLICDAIPDTSHNSAGKPNGRLPVCQRPCTSECSLRYWHHPRMGVLQVGGDAGRGRRLQSTGWRRPAAGRSLRRNGRLQRTITGEHHAR